MLDKFELQNIVKLHGRVPHEEALRHMVESDLLFMALPDRVDGSPGGRISAKTYEYLMTDRPILAALPPGENSRIPAGQTRGTSVGAKGSHRMAAVIEQLASARFNGHPIAIERSDLQQNCPIRSGPRTFEKVLMQQIGLSINEETEAT